MKIRYVLGTGLLLIGAAILNYESAPEETKSTLANRNRSVSVREAAMAPNLPGARSADSEPVSQVLGMEEAPSAAPIVAAKKFLEAHREEWNLQNHHQFVPEMVEMPGNEYQRVAFKIHQGEYPISGMEIVLDVKWDGTVLEVSNSYRPLREASLPTTMTPDEVISANSDRFTAIEGANVTAKPFLYATPNAEEPDFVYSLNVIDIATANTPTSATIRAADGQVLSSTMARAEFNAPVMQAPRFKLSRGE